jgi:CBS domain-containing protein
MIKRRFNHVPVVDPDNGSVVGIIRSTDVMRYVLTKS